VIELLRGRVTRCRSLAFLLTMPFAEGSREIGRLKRKIFFRDAHHGALGRSADRRPPSWMLWRKQ